MRDFWKEAEVGKKKVNKKKIIILVSIILLLVTVTTIAGIYIKNREARDWIDKNIFRKEVKQDKLATIELREGENTDIYAFNQFIGILNKKQFKIYGNTGKEEKTLELNIATPIFTSSNRYLAVAENKGQKLYLITDKDIAWEKQIEGNISQVHVNKNGYVAVTIVDTSYKTVIAMYDNQGKELFNTYLSFNRVSDISISNDNKYLAIAEIDTSGTMIQSNIKVITIERAKSDPQNAITNTFKGENNELITNIRYQDRDKLVCLYTNKITTITADGTVDTIFKNENKKIMFTAIELNNAIATIEEKSSGLFTADSVVSITHTENKNMVTYAANSVTKEIMTYGDVLALNLGTEIEFINTSGWLVKRYKAKQEITNIAMSNNIAGIIYRDRIEIINL